MRDAFAVSGTSPTAVAVGKQLCPAVNYRIHPVTFAVVHESRARDPRRVNHPADVVALIRETALIPDDACEHFVALFLNAEIKIVASHEVSVGPLTGSLVHPREVFGPALRLLGVVAVILVHNHPSGDPTPSQDDIRLTQQLTGVGKVLDVPVHDHFVFGDGTGSWVSLAERGVI